MPGLSDASPDAFEGHVGPSELAQAQLDPRLVGIAVQDVARRSRPGMTLYLVAAVLSIVGDHGTLAPTRPEALLLSILTLLTILRTALVLGWHAWREKHPREWTHWHSAGALGQAVTYSLLAGLIAHESVHSGPAMLCTVVGGAMISAATVVFASVRTLVVWYPIAMISPFTAVLATRADLASLSLAAGALLHAGFHLSLGRRLHRDYWLALAGRRLLERHTAQLETVQAELRSTQQTLEQRIERRTLELREASHEARALAEEYRRLFEGAHDAILVFEPETERVLNVNERACQLYGFSREEFLSLSLKSISKDVAHGEAELLRTLSQGHYRHFETVQYRKDGSEMALEVNAAVLNYRGRTAVLSINRDVTERRRAQELLMAKTAAERASHAKSQFLATMSHELRTPLTSIHGALGLIGGGAAGTVSAEAQELVMLATRNCERLARLVNDVLDFQKVEAGQMTFRLRVQPIGPLLREAVDNMRPYALAAEVRLELAGDETPDARVLVDSGRLIQVVTNLLGNAIKFSPPGGVVRVLCLVSENQVRTRVSDEGPGIPSAFHERLFEKFAQADGSDTRAKGGTGLGLSISRALIEKMGGFIGLEPGGAEERGAVFYFDLPAYEGPTLGFLEPPDGPRGEPAAG